MKKIKWTLVAVGFLVLNVMTAAVALAGEGSGY